MISQPLFRVGDIHVFTGLFEKRRRHHAESITYRSERQTS
jgi:hypothetical protein